VKIIITIPWVARGPSLVESCHAKLLLLLLFLFIIIIIIIIIIVIRQFIMVP